MKLRRFVGVAVGVVMSGTFLTTVTSPASADPFTPVTVTVSRVVEVDDPDPVQGDGDYYAQVQIDGLGLQTGPEESGEDLKPFWNFSGNVDRAVEPTTTTVTVTLKDADVFPAEPDDIIDLNPVDNVQQLVFSVNLDTGAWTGTNLPGLPVNQTCFQGDGDTEHFGSDEGGEEGKLCLSISTLSSDGDADGDGLLDGWERFGFDADGGGVDVDLPAFGANPNHKDIFLELDTMVSNAPTRAGLQAMKTAFANAPIDAGTNAASRPGGVNAKSNPDGLPGINLWIDAGNQTDPTAAEDGGAANSCGDGIDNGGGDGFDTGDTDCLLADNFGGGEQIPASAISDLNSAFYDVKEARFNDNRNLIFRYSLSAAPGFEDGSTAGNSCFDGIDNGGDGMTDGNDNADCGAFGGGWGEVGGNDFIEYNHDGGTIMHELGHTLNLRHGGNQDDNCKPNYVSVMNYDNQFGIRQNAGGSILDYSPARTATGRQATLPNLTENALNETQILDASDTSNQFVFNDANGNKVRNPLNATADYNGDGDTTDNPVVPGVNVDDANSNGRPAACDNGSTNDTHNTFDDWSAISLQFRQFGDSADGAINKEDEPNITLHEMVQLEAELNTTDVSVVKTDSVDPVAAGTNLTYTITVNNAGPNPANDVKVTDALPAEVTHVSNDSGCTVTAGTVNCDLGTVLARASKTINVTVNVGASVVYDNGGPKTITNSASVSFAGTDTNGVNNTESEDTLVKAVADLAVDSIAPTGPALAVIGEPVDVQVRTGVSNGGPSSPIDASVVVEGSSVGNTVTPASQNATVTALAVGSPQNVDKTFSVECVKPGLQTFTFKSTIAPANAADEDPNGTNNVKSASIQVDCVVPIAINIKPGGGNPINTKSGTGVPVAALTTAVGEYGLPLAFDATTIDPLSTRFGTEAEVFGGTGGARDIHNDLHEEDSYELNEATLDGDLDGGLHFRADQTSLQVGDTEACLFGSFTSGGETFHFFGCDAVTVIK
jgi:uncharacterized repeat protein (TIGR01451 family)